MAITDDVAVVSPQIQNNSEGGKTASTVQNKGSVLNSSTGFSMCRGDGKLIQEKEQTWTNDVSDKEICRVPVYQERQIAEEFGNARTEEMNSCMGELRLSSPKERESVEKRKTRSRSRSYSPKRKSKSRSLSSSSSSMSRTSSSSSDSDRSTYSRRRSRSRGRYRSFRTCRRRRSPSRSSSRSPSRSSSRSRSRSYPRCCRSRSRSRSHSRGRHYRFFYKCRSRSRSYRSRSYHRRYRSRSRSRSRSWTRGRRYYGFVQTGRERFVDRSYRTPSRSPSRRAVRLTEKDKLKLLEIAKANASRILGVENVEVPASIKAKVQVSPDINSMKGELNAGHDEKNLENPLQCLDGENRVVKCQVDCFVKLGIFCVLGLCQWVGVAEIA
ncbi:arginine/serine-rich protein 1 [Polypterus senegalus]|uniref:arginine/serine-rich protein 1 n=1 Tax=Polypterus senegalus TaxID=55291 RepID=UPI0019657277|nr:arginine/serine-rich protein 1 [Polypterus senegalus]